MIAAIKGAVKVKIDFGVKNVKNSFVLLGPNHS